jgi:hypothetical protein
VIIIIVAGILALGATVGVIIYLICLYKNKSTKIDSGTKKVSNADPFKSKDKKQKEGKGGSGSGNQTQRKSPDDLEAKVDAIKVNYKDSVATNDKN